MPQTKAQKQKIIEDLKEKIAKQKAMIFADFTGLKAKDIVNLRKKLKAIDAELKVAKKTLIGIALKESKLKLDTKKIAGEVALIFGYKNEIPTAKTLYQFSEENPNLKILGGFFENKFTEAENIITLAQLPSKEELLGRLIGVVRAPIFGLVNTLQGNLRNLVYILSKIKVA